MNVEECFGKVAKHQLQGMMFHSDMTDYFLFLSLYGYAMVQQYHYTEETNGYFRLRRYYLDTYHKLLCPELSKNDVVQVIPDSWKNFSQTDVSSTEKQKGVISGFDKWIEWESNTKHLYCEIYSSLLEKKENAGALFIGKYLQDVDEELRQAQKLQRELSGMNYDMPTIISVQNDYVRKYRKKIRG